MNFPSANFDPAYLLAANILHFIFCAFILVFIGISLNNQNNSHSRIIFKKLIKVAIISLGFDMSSYIFDRQQFFGAKFLSHFSMFATVFFTAFAGYVWNKFYDVIFHIKPCKRRETLYMLPVITIFVLLVINLFTGWLFKIDDNNVYTRGPISLVSFFMQYVLFFVLGVRAAVFKFTVRTIRHLKLRGTFICIALISFITGGMQIIAGGNIALFCFGFTASIFVMFTRFQDDQITNDILTGLNNRYALDTYIEDKIKEYGDGTHGRHKLYLMMMDVNYFKQINDKYGHVEGDKALKLVASMLKTVGAGYGGTLFLSRFGGDEFAAIYETVSEQHVKALCAEIKDSIQIHSKELAYPLTMGVGYALYKGKSMPLTELFDIADKALYEDKDRIKIGN